MTKQFQSASLLSWIVIPLVLMYLFLLTHWPYAIPFHSLSFFGQWSFHLVSNYRLLLLLLFWSIILLHLYQASLAAKLCQQFNFDQESRRLWMIQTICLGIVETDHDADTIYLFFSRIRFIGDTEALSISEILILSAKMVNDCATVIKPNDQHLSRSTILSLLLLRIGCVFFS